MCFFKNSIKQIIEEKTPVTQKENGINGVKHLSIGGKVLKGFYLFGISFYPGEEEEKKGLK